MAPFFSHYESTIDKTFRQVNPATLTQVGGQCLQDAFKHA
jgi:hypothetical protein